MSDAVQAARKSLTVEATGWADRKGWPWSDIRLVLQALTATEERAVTAERERDAAVCDRDNDAVAIAMAHEAWSIERNELERRAEEAERVAEQQREALVKSTTRLANLANGWGGKDYEGMRRQVADNRAALAAAAAKEPT